MITMTHSSIERLMAVVASGVAFGFSILFLLLANANVTPAARARERPGVPWLPRPHRREDYTELGWRYYKLRTAAAVIGLLALGLLILRM